MPGVRRSTQTSSRGKAQTASSQKGNFTIFEDSEGSSSSAANSVDPLLENVPVEIQQGWDQLVGAEQGSKENRAKVEKMNKQKVQRTLTAGYHNPPNV